MEMNPLHLLLLIAATWRLSNLLANEDGPFLMFRKLRRKVVKWDIKYRWFRRTYIAPGVICEYCNSIWMSIALALGYWFLGETFIWVILPLALSTGTIIIKTIVQVLKGVDVYFNYLNTPKITIHQDANPLMRGVPKEELEILKEGGNGQ